MQESSAEDYKKSQPVLLIVLYIIMALKNKKVGGNSGGYSIVSFVLDRYQCGTSNILATTIEHESV